MENSEKRNPMEFLTPAMIVHIIARRRWFIIIPLMVSLLAGIGLAIFLPKKYEAQTLILVEGQRVPSEYVRALVTEDINERINTMSQQILSRTYLEKIIEEFDLFQEPGFGSMFMEAKVDALRQNITVDIAATDRRREADAFTITYKGVEPRQVMNITNTLANYFIDENLRLREAQATGTSTFLEEELKTMRVRLEEKEQAIRKFRAENMGALPGQLETNLRILDRLQNDLTGRQEGLRDARARLAALQNQPLPAGARPGGPAAAPLDVNQLRAELASMQTRYTANHPDIIKLKEQIRYLEENPPDPSAPTAHPYAMELNLEINKLQADIARIQNQIREYERRVESTPAREQELLTLQRDYQNMRDSYNNLLNRKLEAELAVNMERKQKGEQFKVIDRARLPQRPVEPDMRKLFAVTLFAGLFSGLGMIFLLEYFKKPFRSIPELQQTIGLPTLAVIPIIESGRARLFKKVNWTLTGVSVAAALVLLVFFSVLTLQGGESALQIASQIKATFSN